MKTNYNRKLYKNTPQGTKDLLFEECTARKYIEDKLERIFTLRGYNRVMTPGIEYMDLFSVGNTGISAEEMYKFSDLNGRLLALRADATLPIARVASTRLQNLTDPKRLYYFHKIYRNNPSFLGKRNEMMQAGIEVLGIGGVKNDLEILITAFETLNACSRDFRIEISYAGLFKTLIEQLKATDEEKEEIRLLIESKNYGSLNSILDELEESNITKAIKLLPRLFGSEEVFEQAYKICPDYKFKSQLDYLKKIYIILKESGYANGLIVDLGLVHRNDYYSGIVFSGYISGVADSVLKGGRYDKLGASFGMSKPAIGFGVDVDALAMLALENNEINTDDDTVLIHCDNGYEINMIYYAEMLHGRGIRCEYSIFSTLDEAKEYAKKKNMKKIYYAKENIEEIIL